MQYVAAMTLVELLAPTGMYTSNQQRIQTGALVV